MAITKIIGYVLAGLGILGVIASSGKLHDTLPIIKSISTKNMLIISSVLVLVGIGLTLLERREVKQAAEEVPIYAGEGKKRKIVGYQRAK